MKFRFLEFSRKNLFLFLILFFFTPYLFLGLWSYPSADDYTYALAALNKGFYEAQIYYYNMWSGRYLATALLSISPVVFHSYSGYKAVGPLTFIAFMTSSFWFLSAVLGNKIHRQLKWKIFVVFSVLYLSEMPSITEGFNWYPGVVNYTLALILFLAGIGFYLKARGISVSMNSEPDYHRKNVAIVIFLSVVSILLPGINETLVVVWLLLVVLAFSGAYFSYKKWDFSLILPFVLGLACFYIVFRAPGNAVRSALFPENHRIGFTIFRSLGLGVEIFFRYLKIPLVVFLIFSVPIIQNLQSLVNPSFYSPVFRRWTMLVFAGIVFLFLAPAHWAMGGAPARRAMNLICYIHLFFVMLIFSQAVFSKNPWLNKIYNGCARYLSYKWQAAILILSLVFAGNHGGAWIDLLYRAPIYSRENAERIAQLLQANAQSEVVLKPFSFKPETVYFSDLGTDPALGENVEMANYFNVKSVVVKASAN